MTDSEQPSASQAGQNAPANKSAKKPKAAWKFIPLLEFVNGLIHDFSGSFLVTVFKTFGASNQLISAAWLLQLPLSLKAVWAPVVERWGTHRSNLLRCMLLTTACVFVLSAVYYFLGNSSFLLISAVFFVMIMIMSFVEISVKGYKVSVLTSSQIAVYSGISAACFRLGLVTGSSLLVYLVGALEQRYRAPGFTEPQIDSYGIAWSIIFAGAGLVVLLFIAYLAFMLPRPASDKGVATKLTMRRYADVFLSYVRMPGGIMILLFLFFSRFGEGMFKVMWTPFSLDPLSDGGVGVDLKILGVMGPFSLSALVIGGIVGGIVVKVFGLRRTFFALFPLMFFPNLIYSYIAWLQPTDIGGFSTTFFGILSEPAEFQVHWWLLVGGCVELFAYAMAFAPIVVMIDLIAKNAGENKATFAAISGSFLLLGFIAGGGVSGFIQAKVGYFWLFNLTFLVSLPAWFMILKLPLREITERSQEIDLEAELLTDEEQKEGTPPMP